MNKGILLSCYMLLYVLLYMAVLGRKTSWTGVFFINHRCVDAPFLSSPVEGYVRDKVVPSQSGISQSGSQLVSLVSNNCFQASDWLNLAGVLVSLLLLLLLLCSFWSINPISYLSLGPLPSLPPSIFTHDAMMHHRCHHTCAPHPLSVKRGPWLLSTMVAKCRSPLG